VTTANLDRILVGERRVRQPARELGGIALPRRIGELLRQFPPLAIVSGVFFLRDLRRYHLLLPSLLRALFNGTVTEGRVQSVAVPRGGAPQVNPSFQFDADGVSDLQVLLEDGERVLCRGWRADAEGGRSAALAVLLAAERPPPAALERLAHEYELRDALDAAWAARPLALSREGGRTALLLRILAANRSSD
jgi:hypothetical protein